MTAVQFDDYPALQQLVSDEFGPWGPSITVTQAMIDQFADLTGDHQWIHVDVERARAESPFGGPIAHGFLTLSLIPKLMAEHARQLTGQTSSTNVGAESLRFLSPVPAGSPVHARSRVAAAEPYKRGGTLLTRDIEVGVVGMEKPAIRYRMQLLYR